MEEGSGTTKHRGENKDRPQCTPVRGSKREREGNKQLNRVTECEDETAVVPVGRFTCHESQGKKREELNQADHPHGEGGFGNGHALPGCLVHFPSENNRQGRG
jgi:hypothetical protein